MTATPDPVRTERHPPVQIDTWAPDVPVRVAIISHSQVIRRGLIGLVSALQHHALVIDAVATAGALTVWHGRDRHDVEVHDLGSTSDAGTSLREHRDDRAPGVVTPVVGLVHDTGAVVLGLPLVALSVTAEEFLSVLRVAALSDPRVSSSRDRRLPGSLSSQEFRVLELIGAGLSNVDIAGELFLSLNTVKTYIRTAYRKVGVTDRTSAILWAIEHGLAGGRSGQ